MKKEWWIVIVVLVVVAVLAISFGDGLLMSPFGKKSIQTPFERIAPGGGGGPSVEICDNGVDDDNDYAIDMEDNDCYTDGTIYYFSSSLGDDAWSGLNPVWDGTDGPKQNLPEAATILRNIVVPGDKVLLKRGDFFDRSFEASLNGVVGTEQNPIVIGAYGSGSKPIIDPASTNPVIAVLSDHVSTEWLRIEDLHLNSTQPPGQRPSHGIWLFANRFNPAAPKHITISNVDITHQKYGVVFQADIYERGMEDITFENCFLTENYGIPPEEGHTQGLYTSHVNGLVVRNNTFIKNGKQTSVYDHNNYYSSSSNALIEGNRHLDSASAIKLRKVNDFVVRGNYFSGTDSSIVAGGDSYTNTTNLVFEKNVFDGARTGIRLRAQSSPEFAHVKNVIMRNNLFLNVPNDLNTNAVVVSGSQVQENISIYNNLFYNILTDTGGGRAIFNSWHVTDETWHENIRFFNNIFVEPEPGTNPLIVTWDASIVSDGTILFGNNLFYLNGGEVQYEIDGQEYYNLSDFRRDYSNQEQNSVEGDPMLADPENGDYHLTVLSDLAIDNGIDLPGIVDDDFDGVSRPQGDGWDIGAYEFVV